MDNSCLNPLLMIMNMKITHKVINGVKRPNIRFINVNSYIDNFGLDSFINYVEELRTSKLGLKVFEVPCRKCINCRRIQANEWKIRNIEEAKNVGFNNCLFITLTYNDESLRYNPGSAVATLCYDDVVLFFKRLRKKFFSKKIRYFCAAEYGDHTFRPHYHIILYGLSLQDLQFDDYKVSIYSGVADKTLYSSDYLDSIWYDSITHNNLGSIKIGAVSEQSISYVSGYVTKKFCASDIKNFDNGIELPGCYMSRSSGIGECSFEDKKDDLYKYDSILVKSKSGYNFSKLPKYYDRLLKKYDLDEFNKIQFKRLKYNDFLDKYKKRQSNLSITEYRQNLQDLKKKKIYRKGDFKNEKAFK